MKLTTLVASVLFLASIPAVADDLDYSVANAGAAAIKVAGDGTIFVDFVNPKAGGTYGFTMYVWVESGQAATPFPTASCPVKFMKLSGLDATGWFASDPTAVAFVGYGTDPNPKKPGAGYTGVPGGSYQAVHVWCTIPSSGLAADMVQVKVKARTQGIPKLGEGHGVIVRFSKAETFKITSWLSDTSWTPMSDPCYADTFFVVTKGKTLEVATTNPGGFYYNVLVTTKKAVSDLKIVVSPLPGDFVLWGANSTHAWVGEVDVTDPNQETSVALRHSMEYSVKNLPADTTVFLTVHVRYGLACLPSSTYLPRVYTFSASGSGDGYVASCASSMVGVKKK